MATSAGQLQLVGQNLQIALSDLRWATVGSYVRFSIVGPPTTFAGQDLVWVVKGIRLGPEGLFVVGGPETNNLSFEEVSPALLALVIF